jgi:hypothetical protein
MLKHFAAATLGFALLFGATGPAAAGKGGHYWIDTYPPLTTIHTPASRNGT